jgi:uncharacterized protein (UPF0333 family)
MKNNKTPLANTIQDFCSKKTNKKAQAIFSLIMLLVFIGLLFTAITRMDKAESRTETIGETTLELKQIYEEAEKALFYLEQSAIYSINSIVEEINGNNSICNTSYQENIADLLEEKLKVYTVHYPNKDINFPENNYEVTIINNGELLIANAKSDLKITFSKGHYTINPSFSIPFGYDVIALCY